MNQNTSVRGSYLSTSRLLAKHVHNTLKLGYFEKTDNLLMVLRSRRCEIIFAVI